MCLFFKEMYILGLTQLKEHVWSKNQGLNTDIFRDIAPLILKHDQLQ